MSRTCPECGTAIKGRGRYCSDRCKKAAQRKAAKQSENIRLRFTPLVQTILRTAVRMGSLSCISGVDLRQLNHTINKHRYYCWASESSLHLSHYISAKDRGSLHPDNLGIWPDWLNLKLSSNSLPIGRSISDSDWQNSALFCTTEDEAFQILMKRYGKQLRQIEESSPDAGTFEKLRLHRRWKQYESLKRRGCNKSFNQVSRLPQNDFEQLLQQFGLSVPKVPPVPEQERLTLTDILMDELRHQMKVYPHIREAHRQVIAAATEDLPADILNDALSLAVIHQHNEAHSTMNAYDPEHPTDSENLYEIEIIRWRDTDGRWNSTEVPHPDFYKHNPMEF